MQTPVQITFRNVDRSEAVEDRVKQLADKLERYFQPIIGCRVMIEANHRHHHKGNIYHVRIDLTVPGAELVVSKEPGDNHAHEDVFVAVRDAFRAITRKLEDYARKLRLDVKHHETPPHGRISEIQPVQGGGLIETSDGREIQFWSTSVVNHDFEKLSVGDEVRFVESDGEEGPVASTVHVVGKHHVVG
jgi:ribosomal subunit interface protein